MSSGALNRDTLDLLRSMDAVAVTHHNEIECYLVAPERNQDLIERAEQADDRDNQFASTITLLLAAARSGFSVPADLLERVMPGVDLNQP
ncbi:hypothetical protein [Nocardioides sp. W7]|uniref:hypothetical protein n=1 Tax=Nocardioides sp. W7 TaxID=2931390 RepID=UPI001FD32833|nr:hypothetical protein [Nocardioides sp. W7]